MGKLRQKHRSEEPSDKKSTMPTTERPEIAPGFNTPEFTVSDYTKSKFKRDPFVPVGMLAGVGCLVYMWRIRKKAKAMGTPMDQHMIYTRLMFCGCIVGAM